MKNSARWVRGYDLGSGQRKLIGKELRTGVQAEYKAVFSRGQMGAIGLQGKRKRPGAAGEHIQQFAGDKRVPGQRIIERIREQCLRIITSFLMKDQFYIIISFCFFCIGPNPLFEIAVTIIAVEFTANQPVRCACG